MAKKSSSKYPVQFDVTYPDKPLNRWTTFFRIILIIPIFIIFILLGRASIEVGKTATTSFGGIIFLAPLLMILFRKKYPRWWFDWNLEFLRFQNRILAYFYLLRDEYPSTDERQAVTLNIDYPNVAKLNRALPLIKWLLAIPHYIVLLILGLIGLLVLIIAWFAILFTGKYPRFAFDYIVGIMRWGIRVIAYAFMLATDKYPPFSLEP